MVSDNADAGQSAGAQRRERGLALMNEMFGTETVVPKRHRLQRKAHRAAPASAE
jgi:hypothetical protein